MTASLSVVLLTILQIITHSDANNYLRYNPWVSSLGRCSAFTLFVICSSFSWSPFYIFPKSGMPETRIIGGQNADNGRYPYFALMWGTSLCGGALVAPDLVVTAAHVSLCCCPMSSWRIFCFCPDESFVSRSAKVLPTALFLVDIREQVGGMIVPKPSISKKK